LQFENLNRSLAELRKLKTPLAEIKRELSAHADDELRHNKLLADWEARMQEMVKSSEDVQRALHVVEEGRKLEIKRVAGLQGDLTVARKRLDETREKHVIFTDDLRRIETRINELLSSEADRRQAQLSFIETQNRVQVERERAWKEWESSLDSFNKNADTLERRLQEWEVAQHAVKRAQETYEDLVQKFERRINEISEMQRLAEDRFRQEWVTFKADDQKRWTSYTLSQEEIRKDIRTELGKLQTHLTSLSDQAQLQQDIIEQTRDAHEQLYQGMLSQIHELLSAYERIMSTK
jgi:chromosome segregation ATPase